MKPIQDLTVWGEFVHERQNPSVRLLYPSGIHHCIASSFSQIPQFRVRLASLDQPHHGLPPDTLERTDVLFWWGHVAHDQVLDEVVDAVHRRVLEGMGLVVLHSGHYSKIFRRLLGTSCSLSWREAGEKERVWNCAPGHPITEGIGRFFEIPRSEMYGEPFQIPTPDEVIFISWFQGGEVFRSGCTWRRGNGRIFYFSPGHETYPIYHQEEVKRVLVNAAKWASPSTYITDACPNVPIDEAPERRALIERRTEN